MSINLSDYCLVTKADAKALVTSALSFCDKYTRVYSSDESDTFTMTDVTEWLQEIASNHSECFNNAWTSEEIPENSGSVDAEFCYVLREDIQYIRNFLDKFSDSPAEKKLTCWQMSYIFDHLVAEEPEITYTLTIVTPTQDTTVDETITTLTVTEGQPLIVYQNRIDNAFSRYEELTQYSRVSATGYIFYNGSRTRIDDVIVSSDATLTWDVDFMGTTTGTKLTGPTLFECYSSDYDPVTNPVNPSIQFELDDGGTILGYVSLDNSSSATISGTQYEQTFSVDCNIYGSDHGDTGIELHNPYIYDYGTSHNNPWTSVKIIIRPSNTSDSFRYRDTSGLWVSADYAEIYIEGDDFSPSMK